MNHLSTEELAMYVEALEQKKTELLPQKIIEHISLCDQCASEAIEFYEINKSIHSNIISKSRKIKALYYVVPAVAASLLVLLALNFDVFKNPDNKGGVVSGNNNPVDTVIVEKKADTTNTQKDSIDPSETIEKIDQKKQIIVKEQKEVLLASAFVEDNQMERLVDRYRGELRGESIEVITPIEFEPKSDKELVLEWKQDLENELTVEVFNNEAQSIEEATITSNQYQINKKLQKGLYYWKLYNEDYDLIFCGKIIYK